jgi:4-hydroxy-tetrahydrodipicolinate synthase
MDAGACGVMVAPLTGLKTEAQIVTYFADVIAALGEKTPVVYQDYPQSTQADISAQSFLKIVDAHPSVVMFKHEDCPGLTAMASRGDISVSWSAMVDCMCRKSSPAAQTVS